MSTLGIIGSAGRGSDGEAFRGNPRLWRAMQAVTQIVITITKPTHLVSGAAAISDHLAVLAYLEGQVGGLTLHLPAPWVGHGFKETSGAFSQYDAGRTSNYYHNLFSQWSGRDSLADIQRAIEKGAEVKSGAGGFKERNTDIANQATAMLAFTFGSGPALRDGGTSDTMTKYLARRAAPKPFEPIGDFVIESTVSFGPHLPAYHYCLNSLKLYNL